MPSIETTRMPAELKKEIVTKHKQSFEIVDD